MAQPGSCAKEVKTITAQIVKQDPKNKAYYEKNSKEYIAKLQDLDKLYRTTLNKAAKRIDHTARGIQLSRQRIRLKTSRDCFLLKKSRVQTGGSQNVCQKHDVKIIYFEEVASPKVADTLAGEIGAKTEVLNTLEGLSQKNGIKASVISTLWRKP